MASNLFERPKNIRRTMTRAGLKNPRLTRAKTQEREDRRMYKELMVDVKVLTKQEIAKQYTPKKVADLLRRANANLQNLIDKSVRPFWLPEE